MTTADRVEVQDESSMPADAAQPAARQVGDGASGRSDHSWMGTEVPHVVISLEKCMGVWAAATDPRSDRVLLYLHAGGRRCCKLPSHRRLVSRLCDALDASVLVVDYRTAPEYTVGDGIDDAVGAYRLLMAAGYDSEHIVLAVDCADGDLAVMVPMVFRDLGLPDPASVVMMSALEDGGELDDTSHQAATPGCALLPSTPRALTPPLH
ncbi:alpha/beta hydrolase [Rhodococcus sp. 14C212]|uniref:alpha/beta hydrolase fold domain-containing protein n=1 Tax=Rhodococcus sp. 14C212 TaxID=2711209 RepID=UPI0013ECB5F7|nr:alpha/beta hydrolase [Rhodococcus sp. 14C212]